MAAVAAAACPPGSLGNSRTALMLLSHEFREIHRSASLRQDGSSSRGRKTKHNTATRRWIDTVGLPDLAAGKLPSAQDHAEIPDRGTLGRGDTRQKSLDPLLIFYAVRIRSPLGPPLIG